MENATVGRKKSRSPDPKRKPVAVVVKGDPAWKEWLDGGAVHCLMDVSKLVDIAVTDYLKRAGYDRKPPRRLP